MLIDLLFLVAMTYGLYKGFTGGFFQASMNMIKLLVGVLLAMKFSYLSSAFLQKQFAVGTAYMPLFSFLLMFIVFMILMTILSRMVSSQTGKGQYNMVNKGMGVLLWAFVLSFIFSTVVWFGEQSDVVSPTMLATSHVYPYIEPIYPVVSCRLAYILPAFGDVFDSFQTLFTDLAGSAKGECF